MVPTATAVWPILVHWHGKNNVTVRNMFQFHLHSWQIKPNTFQSCCNVAICSLFNLVCISVQLQNLFQFLSSCYSCPTASGYHWNNLQKECENTVKNDNLLREHIKAEPRERSALWWYEHGVCKHHINRTLITHSSLKTHSCPNPTLKLQQR